MATYLTYPMSGTSLRNDQPTTPAQQIDKLKGEVSKANDFIRQLQEKPSLTGTVLRLAEGRATIAVGGNVLNVRAGDFALKVGCTVRVIPDTMAILEVVDAPLVCGDVMDVQRVTGLICEIERNGSARAVAHDGTVKVGDRVVMDSTGSVVVANLGKVPNRTALAQATGVHWDDVGGLTEAKAALREAVEGPIKNAALYAKYGQRPTRGVLLHGAPGCGKTMLGKAAATALAELHGHAAGGAFFYVKGPELLDKFVGNTEAGIRKLFSDARRHEAEHRFPALVFIDEADAILGKRGSNRINGMETTVVPQFLAEMDGLEASGALVILATNRANALDPAVVRDGRIDRRVKVTRPTEEEAGAILRLHLRGRLLHENFSELEIVNSGVEALWSPDHVLFKISRTSMSGLALNFTLGHVVSGATLEGLVSRATGRAMRAEIDDVAYGRSAPGITTGDMIAAAKDVYVEALDVNMDDDLAEFCAPFRGDVSGIQKVGMT